MMWCFNLIPSFLKRKNHPLPINGSFLLTFFPAWSHFDHPKYLRVQTQKKEDLRTLFPHSTDRQGIISSQRLFYHPANSLKLKGGSFEWSNGKISVHLFSLATLPSFTRSLMQQKKLMHAFRALFGIFERRKNASRFGLLWRRAKVQFGKKSKNVNLKTRCVNCCSLLGICVAAFIYYLLNLST